MRTSALTLIALLMAALVAAGCNTYDPELGLTPFKCGVTEPRCPDDYTCVQTSPTAELCVAASQNPDEIPDGGMNGVFSCNDDGDIELNNSTVTATDTQIPNQPSQRFATLAICPANDVDYFSFRVPSGSQVTVSMVLEVGNGDGALTLEMVDGTGTAIGGPAEPDPLDATRLVKMVTNVPPNEYFAKVNGDGVGQNNYAIEISLE